MYKRKFAASLKEYLGLNDFKAVGVGAGSVSFIRKKEGWKDEIVISYSKYPGVFCLRPAISGWRFFDKVESILCKYYKKEGIEYHCVTIHQTSRRDEHIGEIKIAEPGDILQALPSLKQMVYEDLLPFFETYNSLEKVHIKIENLELNQLSNFIYNPPHPQVMIIKRLVNAPDWEPYCLQTIEMYKEQSTGKYAHVFKPIYNFLPALFEELKSLNSNQQV